MNKERVNHELVENKSYEIGRGGVKVPVLGDIETPEDAYSFMDRFASINGGHSKIIVPAGDGKPVVFITKTKKSRSVDGRYIAGGGYALPQNFHTNQIAVATPRVEVSSSLEEFLCVTESIEQLEYQGIKRVYDIGFLGEVCSDTDHHWRKSDKERLDRYMERQKDEGTLDNPTMKQALEAFVELIS